MAVVGSQSYFRGKPIPMKPQDLVEHRCINLRLPTHGGLYAWEFEKAGRELKVRGIYARIVEAGTVRVGDAIAKLGA